MSKNVRRLDLEKNRSEYKNKEKPSNYNFLSKNLKKIYPIGLHRTCSPLSLSSLSLSLSQNSTDSSITDSSTTAFDQKIELALSLIAPPSLPQPPLPERREPPLTKLNEGGLRRCNWIIKSSDSAYVKFHDECWGVPVYDDHQLFELLALSGMLMDFNWTEILRRRELLREAFSGFDANVVAKMGEKEITEIASDKALMLAESRVRCIVDNANCILKVMREHGSLSSYMWNFMNYKPTVNKFRYPRNVPLRTPKAEMMSKDLIKLGFRFVGPVIVYSFMQAAGMTIDHLVDCFRHSECVKLGERPWRHV